MDCWGGVSLSSKAKRRVYLRSDCCFGCLSARCGVLLYRHEIVLECCCIIVSGLYSQSRPNYFFLSFFFSDSDSDSDSDRQLRLRINNSSEQTNHLSHTQRPNHSSKFRDFNVCHL